MEGFRNILEEHGFPGSSKFHIEGKSGVEKRMLSLNEAIDFRESVVSTMTNSNARDELKVYMLKSAKKNLMLEIDLRYHRIKKRHCL